MVVRRPKRANRSNRQTRSGLGVISSDGKTVEVMIDGKKVKRGYGFWRRDSQGRFADKPDQIERDSDVQNRADRRSEGEDRVLDALEAIDSSILKQGERKGSQAMKAYAKEFLTRLEQGRGGAIGVREAHMLRRLNLSDADRADFINYLRKTYVDEDGWLTTSEDGTAPVQTPEQGTTPVQPLENGTTPTQSTRTAPFLDPDVESAATADPVNRKSLDEALGAHTDDPVTGVIEGMGLNLVQPDNAILRESAIRRNPLNFISKVNRISSVIKSLLLETKKGGSTVVEDAQSRIFRSISKRDRNTIHGLAKVLANQSLFQAAGTANAPTPTEDQGEDEGGTTPRYLRIKEPVAASLIKFLKKDLDVAALNLTDNERKVLRNLEQITEQNADYKKDLTEPQTRLLVKIYGAQMSDPNSPSYQRITQAMKGLNAKSIALAGKDINQLTQDFLDPNINNRDVIKTLDLGTITTLHREAKGYLSGILSKRVDLAARALTGRLVQGTDEVSEYKYALARTFITKVIESSDGEGFDDAKKYLKDILAEMKKEAGDGDPLKKLGQDLDNATDRAGLEHAFRDLSGLNTAIENKSHLILSYVLNSGGNIEARLNSLPARLKEFVTNNNSRPKKGFLNFLKKVNTDFETALNRAKTEAVRFVDEDVNPDNRAKEYFDDKEKALKGVNKVKVVDRENAKIYIPVVGEDGAEITPTTSIKKLKYIEMAKDMRDAATVFLDPNSYNTKSKRINNAQIDINAITSMEDLRPFEMLLGSAAFKKDYASMSDAEKTRLLENLKRRVVEVVDIADNLVSEYKFDKNGWDNDTDKLSEKVKQYKEKADKEFKEVSLKDNDANTVEKVYSTKLAAVTKKYQEDLAELDRISPDDSEWKQKKRAKLENAYNTDVDRLNTSKEEMLRYYESNSRVIQYEQTFFEDKEITLLTDKGEQKVTVSMPVYTIPRYVRMNADTEQAVKEKTLKDLKAYENYVKGGEEEKKKANAIINQITADKDTIKTLKSSLTGASREERDDILDQLVELEEKVKANKTYLKDTYGLDEQGKAVALSQNYKNLVDTADLLDGDDARVLPNTERHHEFNDRYVHNLKEFLVPLNLAYTEYEKYYFALDPKSENKGLLKGNGLVPFLIGSARGEQVGFSMIVNKGANLTYEAANYDDPDYRHKFSGEMLQHVLENKDITREDVELSRKGMMIATLSSMLKTLGEDNSGRFSDEDKAKFKKAKRKLLKLLMRFDPQGVDKATRDSVYQQATDLFNEYLGDPKVLDSLRAKGGQKYHYAATIVSNLLDPAKAAVISTVAGEGENRRVEYTHPDLKKVAQFNDKDAPEDIRDALDLELGGKVNEIEGRANPLLNVERDANGEVIGNRPAIIDANNRVNWGVIFDAFGERTLNGLNPERSFGKGYEEVVAYSDSQKNSSGHQVSTLTAVTIGRDIVNGVNEAIKEFTANGVDEDAKNVVKVAQEDALVDFIENGSFLSKPEKDADRVKAVASITRDAQTATDEEKTVITALNDSIASRTKSSSEDTKKALNFLEYPLSLEPKDVKNAYTYFREHIRFVRRAKSEGGIEPAEGVLDQVSEGSRFVRGDGRTVKTYREIVEEFGGEDTANVALYKLMAEVQQIQKDNYIRKGGEYLERIDELSQFAP